MVKLKSLTEADFSSLSTIQSAITNFLSEDLFEFVKAKAAPDIREQLGQDFLQMVRIKGPEDPILDRVHLLGEDSPEDWGMRNFFRDQYRLDYSSFESFTFLDNFW